jgi:hypothetical protein
MAESLLSSYRSSFEGIHIEIRDRIQALRDLRAAFLQIVYALKEQTNEKAYLVLIRPKLSEEIIEVEWDRATRVLRHDLQLRVVLVISTPIGLRSYPDRNIPEVVKAKIDEATVIQKRTSDVKVPRPDFYSEVAKVLARQWLLNLGPMTTSSIEKAVGCTFPTVADALGKMGLWIDRHTDRKVELEGLAEPEWERFLARSRDSRTTLAFVDRSGQPRSAASLVRRIKALELPNVAFGGVIGSKYYLPDLDLIGTPRIDLTLHSPENWIDLGFVHQIDPALQPVTGREINPKLVIHLLRRKEPYFSVSPDGLAYADPIECWLDLMENFMGVQAYSLLSSLNRRKYQK